ncbi:MAG TPA: CBS domain-containing protein [Conexibacter sp.]|nr:CBS domain-containing protein [Conexibacter sp.]
MGQAIRDVMTPDPVCVDPHSSAADAAKRMREVDSGAILVAEDGHLRGLLTDRDIVVRAIAEGRDPARVEVQEICSTDIQALRADDDAERAVQLMRDRHVRRIPVVEGEDHPIGIVSIGDLALARDERSALADISGAPANT